nr:Homeobox protein [Ipomoea batatas]
MCSDEERPALGLKLKKTPSFIEELERKLLSQEGNNNTNNSMFDEGEENNPPPQPMDSSPDFMSQPMHEKLKASNFSAIMLRIGGFERVSRHESDLVAKLYYAKRKLVWEFLEGPLKKKIEIQWSDIGAMRATIEDGQPGVWEIELNQPPLFFHETNPQPRKHTLWQPVGDFTNGHASRIRRHFVKFPRGVLDKHYEKLLQCDPRLQMLSQQPFPTQNPNIFLLQQPTNNSSYEVSDLCLDFQRNAMPNPLNILTHPNPYINIPQNNNNYNYNWFLNATKLPPNTNTITTNIVNAFNNETQSSSSTFPLPDTWTHEYPMNPICNYPNPNNHLIDNQVVTYNNHQTMAVANSVPGGNNNFHPNMDAVLSFYPNNLHNNVSNGQALETHHHVAQGTLYHGSPWVPSHFTNGDHSPAGSTGEDSGRHLQ